MDEKNGVRRRNAEANAELLVSAAVRFRWQIHSYSDIEGIHYQVLLLDGERATGGNLIEALTRAFELEFAGPAEKTADFEAGKIGPLETETGQASR